MAALSMFESQNYMVAAVFLFFAFYMPLLDDLNALFRRKFGIGVDSKIGPETDREVVSEEGNR